MKTHSYLLKSMGIILVGLLVFPCVAFSGNTSQDGGGMAVINPASAVYSQQAIKQARGEDKGVPWFNGTGTIDQIVENGLVINDVTRVYSRDVQFGSEATGQPLPSSSFKPGKKVGFVLNSSEKVTSVWLLEKQ